MDQFVAGVEHRLLGPWTVQAQFIHREFRSFMAFVDVGAAWTPVQRRDPGPDGLERTADDGDLFTVYSRSAIELPGGLYTNPDDAWRRYRGLQLITRTAGAGSWHVQASYTRSRTRGTASPGFHANAGRLTGSDNPNRLINGDASTAFDPTHEAKILGLWTPTSSRGFTASSVYRYLSGAAWARSFIVVGLPQSVETVLAEPRGTRRVEAIKQVDVRVEKALRVRGVTLGVFAEVFNVSNQGAPDSEWVEPVNTASGPSLGSPFVWRHPRQIRVGARFDF